MPTTNDYSQPADFPEFDRPPVVETAIAVVFLPSPSWKLKHFIEFGRAVAETYPNSEPRERLIQTPIEDFGGTAPTPHELVFEAGAALWWYATDDGSRLIQLQKDRFVHNWRKRTPVDSYPRYQHTREEFRQAWRTFEEFLQGAGIPYPTVLQVEVDYINQIEKSQGWETAADMPHLTPMLAAATTVFLPTPEAEILGVRYAMPNRRGRLHVTIQPAIRNIDKVEIVQLTLTARGRPAESDLDAILQWCDVAHEWIVKGFVEVTTQQMHTMWGRTK